MADPRAAAAVLGPTPRALVAVAVALPALVALALALPPGARAAAPDSAAALAALGNEAAAASMVPAATPATQAVVEGFTVHRVPNPRYRPPSLAATALPAIAARGRALDRVRGRLAQRGTGPGSSATEWELGAGEEIYGSGSVELSASGARDATGSSLREVRLDHRVGDWSSLIGDAPPIRLGQLAALNRLRGATVELAPSEGAMWHLLGGVPTPIPNVRTRDLWIAGLSLDRARFDEATVSFTMLGFSRVAARALAGAADDPDTAASRGGGAELGWQAPLLMGRLSGSLGTELRSADGRSSLAAQHALEWRLVSPLAVILLRDERSTANARVLGTERFAPAPRSADQWNLQSRFLGGRMESHFAGTLRDDADPTLATRTLIVGASGNLGASPWYGGLEATWDRRPVSGDERRQWLHAGFASAGGHALTARIERNDGDGRAALTTLAADGSFSLGHGRRIDVEPRVAWDAGQLRDAEGTLRWSLPLKWASARFGGAAAVGGTRDARFRGVLHEASLSFTWQPGSRDLGELEVRRLDSGGGPSFETTAGYETSFQRREGGTTLLAARDSGRVMVQVIRSGDRAGITNALVSLDGRELRFTDEDGFARFDHVAVGVHVVSIEERSLPPANRVVDGSRVFIAVQRGVVTPTVLFRVERPERTTHF